MRGGVREGVDCSGQPPTFGHDWPTSIAHSPHRPGLERQSPRETRGATATTRHLHLGRHISRRPWMSMQLSVAASCFAKKIGAAETTCNLAIHRLEWMKKSVMFFVYVSCLGRALRPRCVGRGSAVDAFVCPSTGASDTPCTIDRSLVDNDQCDCPGTCADESRWSCENCSCVTFHCHAEALFADRSCMPF